MSSAEDGASASPEAGTPYTTSELSAATAPRLCTVVPDIRGTPAEVFGLLPDMRDWVPGDVVLFASHDKFNGVIELVQRRAWKDAARWTHAALYVGNGCVVESLFSLMPGASGVQRRPISVYPPQREMVRLFDPKLKDAARRQLVEHVEAITAGYDVMRALRVALDELGVGGRYLAVRSSSVLGKAKDGGRRWRSRRKDPETRAESSERVGRPEHRTIVKDTVPAIEACICSDLIDFAYQKIVGDTAAPQVRRFVPPAALYRSPRFTRHEVRLCRLAAPVSG